MSHLTLRENKCGPSDFLPHVRPLFGCTMAGLRLQSGQLNPFKVWELLPAPSSES